MHARLRGRSCCMGVMIMDVLDGGKISVCSSVHCSDHNAASANRRYAPSSEDIQQRRLPARTVSPASSTRQLSSTSANTMAIESNIQKHQLPVHGTRTTAERRHLRSPQRLEASEERCVRYGCGGREVDVKDGRMGMYVMMQRASPSKSLSERSEGSNGTTRREFERDKDNALWCGDRGEGGGGGGVE